MPLLAAGGRGTFGTKFFENWPCLRFPRPCLYLGHNGGGFANNTGTGTRSLSKSVKILALQSILKKILAFSFSRSGQKWPFWAFRFSKLGPLTSDPDFSRANGHRSVGGQPGGYRSRKNEKHLTRRFCAKRVQRPKKGQKRLFGHFLGL